MCLYMYVEENKIVNQLHLPFRVYQLSVRQYAYKDQTDSKSRQHTPFQDV